MSTDNKISKLNFREINLSIFRGESPGTLLWQPRLEYWYDINKKQGTLPDNLKEVSLLDVYDYCHASVRYFTKPLGVRHNNVHVTEQWEDETRLRRTWETPVGRLTDVMHFDKWRVSRHYAEYKLKNPEDFEVLEYIFQDEAWYWDQQVYEQDLKRVGERGCPQFYFRRSPIHGIPAILFLPNLYSVDALFECANQVVELFYPRLILGISDELPPDADIERVRLIGKLAQKLI